MRDIVRSAARTSNNVKFAAITPAISVSVDSLLTLPDATFEKSSCLNCSSLNGIDEILEIYVITEQ